MRRGIRILAVSGLVVVATWQGAAAHAQRNAGLNTTQTIQISAATKVLDLGSNDSNSAPSNWTSINFDDSAWSPASQVSSDVVACAVQNHSELSPMQSAPAYWGSNEGDNYLFRQTFTLPQAKGYYGSTFAFGADGGDALVNVNGQQIDSGVIYNRDAIGQYLRPGANVVAFYFHASGDTTASNEPCSMLTFTINLIITGVQTPSTAPAAPAALSTILPGHNAILSGSASLPFSRNRYSGVRYYYLQIWLTNPAPGQRITARTVTTFTARLTGASYTLNTSHMPKGAYSWRMAAVDGSGKLLSGWTLEQTVTMR